MNCTHIAHILPLYVGDDLDLRRAGVVRAHLESCEACRQLAAEHAESRRWLRAHAAPAFDDEFFAGLRAAVQREIASQRGAPSRLQLLAPRWRWQPALVISLALLLFFAGRLVVPRSDLTDQRARVLNDLASTGGGPMTTDHQSATLPRKPSRTPLRRPRPAISFTVALEKQEPAEASAQAPATEPEMLRIEIQTADPKIRIIWLIPQDKALTESD